MSDVVGAINVPSHNSNRTTQGTPERRSILGVEVCVATHDQAVVEVERAIDTNQHRKFAFLNAHGANLTWNDAEYRKVLNGFQVFSDGVGLDIASKVLYGEKFPSNLNGTDFVPHLLGSLKQGRTIAMIGSAPGVAKSAATHWAKIHPQHKFIAISDGYFDEEKEHCLLAGMENQEADILLVAFGNPKQEKWISEHCTQHHGTAAIGVGALFDFVSGRISRAPDWMIRARIEWVYRLMLEPGRMWRRYILGNPLFIFRVLQQKFFGLSWQEKQD